MKVKVRKHKKIPAPLMMEQVKEKWSCLSDKYCSKSGIGVKPQSLSDLYGCRLSRN